MAKYILDFLSPAGIKLYSTPTFINIDLTRAENSIGVLKLDLPFNFARRDLLVPDARIIVNRILPNGYSYVEGETHWWIRTPVNENKSARTLSVTAFDNMELLNRRVIPYQPGSTQAELWDTAEAAMKYVVRTNLGSSVTDTNRDLSAYLSVDADMNIGPILQRSVSGRIVFDVLKELADASKEGGVYLIFDIVSDPVDLNSFTFRIWQDIRGVDRGQMSSQQLIISEESGSLASPQYVEDYSQEINTVYAGGEGNTTGQITTLEIDAVRAALSPFNRRETYISSPNADNIEKLQADAQAALRAGRPKIYFSGKVSDTNQIIYGLSYKYGDIVAARYNQKVFDCHINAAHLQFANRQEVLDIYARHESE